MNKAKLKRIRKELEKLLGSGRYREGLELIEKENLFSPCKREWQECWQNLARLAVRTPRGLMAFLSISKRFKQYPDLPDIRFLFLLEKFINGDDIKEELTSLKGLSFPAEPLKKQTFFWNDALFPEQKLKSLLNVLITKPEKVTEENYNDLASLLRGARITPTIKTLGEMIKITRSPNSKSIDRIRQKDLYNLDLTLEEASHRLPGNLQQILFYPFLFNINTALNLLLKKKDDAPTAEILSSMPFLIASLAGEKSEYVKGQLMHFNSGALDHSYIGRTIAEAGFEEKIALLGKMRSLIRDDETKEEFLGDFRALYKGILSDIAGMSGTLSEREKREMPSVMGPVIITDLQLLFYKDEDLAHILHKAAEAGCLETKLSTLALILSEKLKARELKEYAEKALRNLNLPGKDDVVWVMNHFREIIFPHVRFLKPLLDLYGEETSFCDDIAKGILADALTSLVFNSVFKKIRGLLSFFAEGIPYKKTIIDMHILRENLNILIDYNSFSLITALLNCFPEDSFTEQGYQRFLKTILERRGGMEYIIEIFEDVNRSMAIEMMPQDFRFSPFGEPFKIYEQGFINFLMEHWDYLKTSKLETLEKLIRILGQRGINSMAGNLLIQLKNLFEERLQKGEKEAGNLREMVMKMLIKSKSKTSHIEKPKKRQRLESFW